VEFRCASTGARFVVVLSRRSPLHKFVIQGIKNAVPRRASASAEGNDTPSPSTAQADASPDGPFLTSKAFGWLMRLARVKADATEFRCRFATGTYKEIQLRNHIELRQQGYLSLEELQQADRIIQEDQDTPRQPQTEETVDWIRQVQIRLAQLRYAIAQLMFREHLINVMTKWRPSALALLSIPFIVIASCIVWANGTYPGPSARR
jgi:hypothetical protein